MNTSFEEVALARLELSSLPLFSYLLLDVWFSFSIWSNAFFYVMFCHKKESLHLGFDLLLLLPLWFWPLPICLLPLFSTIKTSKYDDVICILHSIASFRTLFFTYFVLTIPFGGAALVKDTLKILHESWRVFNNQSTTISESNLLPYQKVDQNILEIYLEMELPSLYAKGIACWCEDNLLLPALDAYEVSSFFYKALTSISFIIWLDIIS